MRPNATTPISEGSTQVLNAPDRSDGTATATTAMPANGNGASKGTPAASSKRGRKALIIAVISLVVAVACAGGAWWYFLGPGSYWLRPPYGFISQEELRALGTPAICWSVDTEDWKSRDVDSILDIVLRRAGDGDILLLHDCYATSVTAALEIVDRLQPRGVRFVTVEELFAVKGVQPACGTLYRRVRGE